MKLITEKIKSAQGPHATGGAPKRGDYTLIMDLVSFPLICAVIPQLADVILSVPISTQQHSWSYSTTLHVLLLLFFSFIPFSSFRFSFFFHTFDSQTLHIPLV